MSLRIAHEVLVTQERETARDVAEPRGRLVHAIPMPGAREVAVAMHVRYLSGASETRLASSPGISRCPRVAD